MHAIATEKIAAGEYLTVTEQESRKGQNAVGTSGYGAKGRAAGAPVLFPNVGKLYRLMMAPRVTFTGVRVPPVRKAPLSPMSFPLVSVILCVTVMPPDASRAFVFCETFGCWPHEFV